MSETLVMSVNIILAKPGLVSHATRAPLLARSAKDRIIFRTRRTKGVNGLDKKEAKDKAARLLLEAQSPRPLEDAGKEPHGLGEVWQRCKDWQMICLASQWVLHLVERARLYEEAMKARDDAIAAMRAKDDFLAALSHELRTPLNPVLLLASECAGDENLPDEVRSVFGTIRNNVRTQARLIDDLLDLTRIVRGKIALEMKPTDIHAVLREAVGIVSPDIIEKRIQLSVGLHAGRTVINGDSVRLLQVFWNVLRNAIKFTPAGGQIGIVTLVKHKEKRLLVRISDSGIGLSPADADRIFEAFSQATPRQGGLGLGLTISRGLLNKLGGSIRATSPGLGKGTTFEIELPLAPSAAAGVLGAGRDKERSTGDARPLPAVAPPSTGPLRGRILLIEDHAATRIALEKLLARRGFEVIPAGSASEARAVALKEDIDLVISDLGLPDGDGCTLFKEIRASRPKLSGVALSGYGMDEDIRRTREAGFAEHLTKPVDVTALERALARLLA